jgi:hypothetical protein
MIEAKAGIQSHSRRAGALISFGLFLLAQPFIRRGQVFCEHVGFNDLNPL